MVIIKPQSGKVIDQTIAFLVKKYAKNGHNEKPVILHSLNVAFYLLEKGYDLEIAQAALLHDLIEDSNTKIEEINLNFGQKIAILVDALSFNKDIKNEETRYQELFNRVKAAGKEALIVKCADIYVNSFYIKFVKDEKQKTQLIDKGQYFLNISKPEIGKEIVWQELKNREEKLRNQEQLCVFKK